MAHSVEQISVATGGSPEADDNSYKPSISNDGSTVVFHTNATNLDGSDDNGTTDVYLHYKIQGSTELISANLNTGKVATTPAVMRTSAVMLITWYLNLGHQTWLVAADWGLTISLCVTCQYCRR